MFPASGNGAQAVLASVAWMVGEYPDLLPDPQSVLSSLLHSSSAQFPANILAIYVQAIPKVFARLTSNQERSWTASRKSQSDLLMARIIHFLEPLVQHPNLEVQERAVEYLELMRVTSEAIQAHAVEGEEDGFVDAPLLLTQAIPSLFMGQELNPVAPGALSKVPLTEGLDLDTPINDNLQILLSQADYDDTSYPDEDNVSKFYFEKASATAVQPTAAADYLEPKEVQTTGSYQSEDRNIDPKDIAKKKAERRERYRDDPFYIDSERGSGTSTPLHNILKSSNGEDLDIDSIPVMDLQLDSSNTAAEAECLRKTKASKKSRNKRIEIAQDETIGDDTSTSVAALTKPSILSRPKKSLLHVDSSGLSALSLSEDTSSRETQLDFERRQQEEEEMAKAIKEVERARLEMQRAQERVEASHIPEEGTVVKRKKKKTKTKTEEEKPVDSEKPLGDDAQDTTVVKKKKKKKAKEENADDAVEDAGAEVEAATVKMKRKKKRQINFDEQADAPAA
ncbi:Adaptor protein complex AP-3 delta subunit [Aureobasidium sp. EXF-8845]|nr:Adaptor protein complex AP-3 delta subunit [Aureobasidium sp. EXF-8845]